MGKGHLRTLAQMGVSFGMPLGLQREVKEASGRASGGPSPADVSCCTHFIWGLIQSPLQALGVFLLIALGFGSEP